MGINQNKFDAGLVYFMALALHRRSPGHAGVIEAIEWLRERGHSREAARLAAGIGHFIELPVKELENG